MSCARLRSSAILSLSALQDSIKSVTSIRAAPSEVCSALVCYSAASALARCASTSRSVITALLVRTSSPVGRSWLRSRRVSAYSARLCNSNISSLSVTQKSRNSEASCSAYTA
ncbi:hypothetical protein Tco_1396763 [Tanacetum coccineum]